MRSRKPRSIFFEVTDHAIRGAVLSAGGDGQTRQLEQVKECSVEAPGMVKDFIQAFATGRGTGLVRSCCGVYPRSRLLRLIKLEEPIRLSEPRVLANLVSKELRVNPGAYEMLPLNPDEGTIIAPARAAKNIFVCGAQREELNQLQDQLIQKGIYPERMEVGSIATLGMLLFLMKGQESSAPLLVLEIGSETSMVFILSNNRIDAARPITFGLNSMVAVLKEELALKDDAAARKLFFSDSFDLTEMGPRLVDRLLRELQSSVGYYEVQTGQSIGKVFCSLLPKRLTWLNGTFAEGLGTAAFQPDMDSLLTEVKITPASNISTVPVAWLGLIGLMASFEGTETK